MQHISCIFIVLLVLANCSSSQPPAPAHVGTPLIFQEAFSPGTQFWVNKEPVYFRVVNLGNIGINSGQIIAGDPTIAQQKAFTASIPPGEYPIQVAVAQLVNRRFNAFVRIKFSDKDIEYWEMALRPGQTLQAINAKQFFGIIVKSEKMMLLDASVYDSLGSRFAANKEFANFVDKKFNQLSGYSNIELNKDKDKDKDKDKHPTDSVFVIHPGTGNGAFAAYFAYDVDKKPVAFLLDFYVIPWTNP